MTQVEERIRFATGLQQAITQEIEELKESSESNEYKEEHTKILEELLAQTQKALYEEADMEEFWAINTVFEARKSTIERELAGKSDIPFNDATGQFITDEQ